MKVIMKASGIFIYGGVNAVIIYLWCQTFRLSDVVANAVLTAYVIIGTILEERKLAFEFGDSYIQYQKEVPMLIPFTK